MIYDQYYMAGINVNSFHAILLEGIALTKCIQNRNLCCRRAKFVSALVLTTL